MPSTTIFVSYAHDDVGLRDGLKQALDEVGIQVWTDTNLVAGESFNEKIAEAIFESRALVLISTGNSSASRYVDAEVAFARKLGKPVCEVSVAGVYNAKLTNIQRVDYRPEATSWDDIVSQLAPALRRAIGPREVFVAYEIDEQEVRDKEFVEWVVAELKKHELDMWYEPERVRIGDDPDKEIKEAIDRAGVVLAVISEKSAASERFCEHVVRAISQEDTVIRLLHRSAGTTDDGLLQTWSRTMMRVAEQEKYAKWRVVIAQHANAHQLPAVFVDYNRDVGCIREIAGVLKDRQKELGPDEELEKKIKEIYHSFVDVLDAEGYDVATVLGLPSDALTEAEHAGATDQASVQPVAPQAAPVGQAVQTAAPAPASQAAPPKSRSRVALGAALGVGGVLLLIILWSAFSGGSGDSVATDRGEIVLGEPQSAVIERTSQKDHWRFTGTGGDVVIISVALPAGSSLDPEITLLSTSSEQVAKADDAGSGESEQLSDVLPADGEYVIQVNPWSFDSVGEYILTVVTP